MVFLCIAVHDGAVRLAVSGLSVAAIWNHAGKSVARPLLFFKRLFFSGSAFLFFCFPPPFFSLSTVITV